MWFEVPVVVSPPPACNFFEVRRNYPSLMTRNKCMVS